MSLNQLSFLERNATSYIFYEHLASLLNKELFFFPFEDRGSARIHRAR